jgi:hypothetical protein
VARGSSALPRPFAGITSVHLWHQRLGHPGHAVLRRTLSSFSFECSKSAPHTCHAYQIGKNMRLPFHSSETVSYFPFQLLHLNIWTSPVVSVSGYQFYLVVLDDFSHYTWTFPLRHKSDAYNVLVRFLRVCANTISAPCPCSANRQWARV